LISGLATAHTMPITVCLYLTRTSLIDRFHSKFLNLKTSER
jgi:hypothetical protein